MPVMEGQTMAEDLLMVEDPAMAAAPTVGMEALAMVALALAGIAAVDLAMVAPAEVMEVMAMGSGQLMLVIAMVDPVMEVQALDGIAAADQAMEVRAVVMEDLAL